LLPIVELQSVAAGEFLVNFYNWTTVGETARKDQSRHQYSTRMSGSSFHRLLIARELLRDCYREPLSLWELAATAGLSEFHFLRVYRDAFGETPHQHFTRLRFEHAKRALARGASVTEVCFDVGYSSLGTFSWRFARATGRSPRAWQREVRALVSVPADLARLYIPGCFLGFFVDPATSSHP
jgi:AraC-like DNA-binding protein